MEIELVNLMAELGKLSQGKRTEMPAEQIAGWAIDRIRGLEHDEKLEQLERMYSAPDTRTGR